MAPTFLEAAGLTPPEEMTGKSLINTFNSDKNGYIDPARDCVVTGMGRHAVARIGDVEYPMRAIRTREYLYIINYEPGRWPAGNPELYADIDDSPTKQYMMDHRDDIGIQRLFNLAFGKRFPEELYVVEENKVSIDNVADDPAYAEIKKMLCDKLEHILTKQKNPGMEGKGYIFDTYPHYGDMKRLEILKK